jgi:hypothetical protein
MAAKIQVLVLTTNVLEEPAAPSPNTDVLATVFSEQLVTTYEAT